MKQFLDPQPQIYTTCEIIKQFLEEFVFLWFSFLENTLILIIVEYEVDESAHLPSNNLLPSNFEWNYFAVTNSTRHPSIFFWSLH